eukprot:4302257-Amphidinium_carterae.1
MEQTYPSLEEVEVYDVCMWLSSGGGGTHSPSFAFQINHTTSKFLSITFLRTLCVQQILSELAAF